MTARIHPTCGKSNCGNWAACDRRNPDKAKAAKDRGSDEALNEALVDIVRANLRRRDDRGGRGTR